MFSAWREDNSQISRDVSNCLSFISNQITESVSRHSFQVDIKDRIINTVL